jgi:hypothetical protein
VKTLQKQKTLKILFESFEKEFTLCNDKMGSKEKNEVNN